MPTRLVLVCIGQAFLSRSGVSIVSRLSNRVRSRARAAIKVLRGGVTLFVTPKDTSSIYEVNCQIDFFQEPGVDRKVIGEEGVTLFLESKVTHHLWMARS